MSGEGERESDSLWESLYESLRILIIQSEYSQDDPNLQHETTLPPAAFAPAIAYQGVPSAPRHCGTKSFLPLFSSSVILRLFKRGEKDTTQVQSNPKKKNKQQQREHPLTNIRATGKTKKKKTN